MDCGISYQFQILKRCAFILLYADLFFAKFALAAFNFFAIDFSLSKPFSSASDFVGLTLVDLVRFNNDLLVGPNDEPNVKEH